MQGTDKNIDSRDTGEEGTAVTRQFLRVAAYVICIRDDHLLLARFTGNSSPRWTLPGGGLDHGEHPEQAAIREVEEETGFVVRLTGLLGIDSIRERWTEDGTDFQGLRIIYSARITGGALRHEIGGSTDMAAWVPLDEVPALERVGLVDIGLDLARLGHPQSAVRNAGCRDGG